MTQILAWSNKISRISIAENGYLKTLGVAVLMLGSILLWLPSLDLPLDIDAACYAVAAYWWAHGDTLYRHFTITRPQGIFVVYRIIQAIGFDSVAGIRFAGAIYCALCVLALLLVVRRVWGEAIGFGAAELFALIMTLPSLEGPTTNAELYMLLPLLVSLFLLLLTDGYSLGSRRNLLLLAGCGLCGAVALIIKPSGVAALALAALWLLRRQNRERFSWSAWLRAESILGASFLLGLLPALLHGLLTAPDIYLYAVFLYRLETASAVSRPLTAQLGRFVFVTGQVLVRLPILLVAVSGWLAVRRAGDSRGRDLLYLWTLVSLGGASLGGNWWILLLPATCATASGGDRHRIALSLQRDKGRAFDRRAAIHRCSQHRCPGGDASGWADGTARLGGCTHQLHPNPAPVRERRRILASTYAPQ